MVASIFVVELVCLICSTLMLHMWYR